jgi:hypothetical protein
MPEIKHQFTAGRMNKDVDERLIPNGEYRDAMNIQVATSEGSDVGTAQNILGNMFINFQDSFALTPNARTIGCIADEKNDTLYYLVWDTDGNYIISHLRTESVARPVFVDRKNILGFEYFTQITGINIIDDMLFWTDNKTEPKKINISRSRQGTQGFANHTRLINQSQGLLYANAPDVEERHVTVIKRGPYMPLRYKLGTTRDASKIYTGVITITSSLSDDSSIIQPSGAYDFSTFSTEEGSNVLSLRIIEAIDQNGNLISADIDPSTGNYLPNSPFGPINYHASSSATISQGLTGWWGDNLPGGDGGQFNIAIGTKVVLKPFNDDGDIPGLPVTDYVIKAEVIDANPDVPAVLDPITGAVITPAIINPENTWYDGIKIKILSMDGYPPPAGAGGQLKYVVDLFDDTEKLFEFKFPRFSYRYKYKDNEYSTFAPWTLVAFKPGPFDYHPRKGYNLGMTNRINKIELFQLVTKSTPKDVISIDILFKDETSPNIYVVDTIRKDDNITDGTANKWNKILNSSGPYVIDFETVNSVVPSNQLLRPWDNVPRKALAQDVTGNRIVYGNYVQNYDLTIPSGENYVPQFTTAWYNRDNFEIINNEFVQTNIAGVNKSIKSLREYQLGVVFVDKYGRETPVISNATGTIKLEKKRADKYNALKVSINTSSLFPSHEDLKYFKFYIKETADEYYNMAMDRWYNADDGNVWLAFPSSDRNKLDIDTFLILKKGSETDDLVAETAKYKVIAIENEAPDFVKTKRQLAVSINHSTTSKDLYGGSLGDGPVEGRDNITINYSPFLDTPGRHLATYSEGKLYIEWENPATKQTSDRYEIVSIENNFDNGIPGNGVIIQDAKYSIQLAENLKADVNFITDDPSGLNSTKILDGTVTNIYKYTIENKPQFDGRFFVKIYEDDIFEDNIGKSFKDNLDYRVVSSKKVFYMKPDHRLIHTTNIDDFLVDGNDQSVDSLVGGTETTSEVFNNKYGYYAISEFASMALFFRRYGKNEVRARYPIDQAVGGGNTGVPVDIQYPYDDDMGLSLQVAIPVIAHLKPTSSSTPTPQFFDSSMLNGAGSGQYIQLGMTYLSDTSNPYWTPVTDWNREFGAYAPFNKGYTNWFDFPNGVYKPDTRVIESLWNGGSLWNQAGTVSQTDHPRDTEVWFIDAGPYAGRAYDSGGNGDLSVNTGGDWSLHRYEMYYGELPSGGILGSIDPIGSTANPAPPPGAGSSNDPTTPADDAKWNSGIVEYSGAAHHAMNLAFGGIKGAVYNEDSPGLFNIGGWNTSSGGSGNSTYSDLEPFIRNLNSGFKFRWKQDPTQTVYTIGGNNESSGYLRHSTVKSEIVVDWGASPVVKHGATSMAELLSFNFTKNWTMKNITPAYGTNWYPLADGKIPNSLEVTLTTCSFAGTLSSGATATGGLVGEDLKIFVTDIVGTSNYEDNTTLKVGMAFSDYTRTGGGGTTTNVLSYLSVSNTMPLNEFLVIRRIETLVNSAGTTYYALTLGGYREPLRAGEHKLASVGITQPKLGEEITFVQVGMNGYSPNSEFNINTIAYTNTSSPNIWGAVTAVGYDIEFIEYIEPEELLSENPAIWETEPKELPKLDIYYEASADIPMIVDAETVSSAFTVGSTVIFSSGFGLQVYYVVGHLGDLVLVKSDPAPTSYQAAFSGINNVTIVRHDGVTFEVTIDINVVVTDYVVGGIGSVGAIKFNPILFDLTYNLPWHNCFSFGNGVESNRIRDAFNLPYIMNGVKVSTTLEYEYKEEHRKNGLIYSGLYNAISGVNNLNQFIQAEKITKDINPIYGSIQKLHARDADLVTLCEDKVLKILSQKDALYNADGNINLTATERVLGQAIPFAGEYGISTNPESFASENYRVYFADRVRGAVLRLSMDGLTPISDYGMKDWFRDNLKLVKDGKIIGSYDDRSDEYVLKLEFLDFNYGGNNYNIAGCTDPTAYNYDASATVDDGSCVICFYGCTNSLATNYDALATCDDGSCTYTSIWGCTDSTALNYNALAIYNDGSCTYDVLGCMDPTACNYNPLATLDDSSCFFAEPNTNCLGACLPGYVLVNGVCVACVYGCTNLSASNYVLAATCDDGSCLGVVYIYGCTDPTATNYNAAANVDDGSCTYPAGCTVDGYGNIVIPDPNFKAYLVGNTAINTNGDTEISAIEATAYTGGIFCASLSITDLTGIECFTALTTLYCHSNQLTSLDVSQNTALTGLGFYNNQLTSLDVSQNTALTFLNCASNQLTNLNIQNGNNNNMPSSAFVVAPATTGTGTLTITSDSGGPITPNGSINYTNVPPGTLWI